MVTWKNLDWISNELHNLFFLLGTVMTPYLQLAYITRKTFPKQTLSSLKTPLAVPRSWSTRLEIRSLGTAAALGSELYFVGDILPLLPTIIFLFGRSFSLPVVTRMPLLRFPLHLRTVAHYDITFFLSPWLESFFVIYCAKFWISVCLGHPNHVSGFSSVSLFVKYFSLLCFPSVMTDDHLAFLIFPSLG